MDAEEILVEPRLAGGDASVADELKTRPYEPEGDDQG